MPQPIIPRLQVFVSSRMGELAHERKLVKDALDELKVDAWLFEQDAGARPDSIEETFLREVGAADLYLGIFWKGYGPYTREEYEHAAKLKKDRLVYEKRTDLGGRESELAEFLEELNHVETGVTPKWFHSAEELREFVKEDVARWQASLIRQRREIAETVAVLERELVGSEEERELLMDQVRALTQAVTALTSEKGHPYAPSLVDQALEELAAGRTETAKDLFGDLAAEREAAGVESLKEAAEAQRHLGALALLDDTEAALAAYNSATKLDPDNPEGWNRLGQILMRIGDLAEAEAAFQEVLGIGESMTDADSQAIALGNLGVVYQTRGELDRAVEMYKEALALNEELDRKLGMALNYDGLGTVFRIRGELDRAVEMYKEALALSEGLNWKEGIASNCDHLGTVYLTRGELDRAEEMYKRALDLEEELGRKKGIANRSGSLGLLHHTRGDLDKATEMYERALAFHRQLGDKCGIANYLGNLANIHLSREELDQAEEKYKIVIALDEELGRKREIATGYGNLAIVHTFRGELDQAEKLNKKALVLNIELGHKEGMALNYSNLGTLYQRRGELEQARDAGTKARDLFAEIGNPDAVQQKACWLEELDEG